MSRRYVTLDVFAERPFAGNPLAVMFDAEGLDDAAMQAIAQEFNYSETTFLLPPEDPRNTATLRIFTPTREVPFAGHPNIGSALAVARRGALFGQAIGDEIVFEERAGLVRIAVTRENGAPIEAELTAPTAFSLGATVDVAAAAACARLDPGDIADDRHGPVAASVGLPFVFAEVRDAAALARARPGPEEAFAALPPDAPDIMIYVRDGDSGAQARMFAPLDNIPEDPATGSACAALMGLTAHLDPRADGVFALDIGQGEAMGRPSRIRAAADKSGGVVSAVRVAGRAHEIMEGRLLA